MPDDHHSTEHKCQHVTRGPSAVRSHRCFALLHDGCSASEVQRAAEANAKERARWHVDQEADAVEVARLKKEFRERAEPKSRPKSVHIKVVHLSARPNARCATNWSLPCVAPVKHEGACLCVSVRALYPNTGKDA